MNFTTVIQSLNLLEEGLDRGTADLMYINEPGIRGIHIISDYLTPEPKDTLLWSTESLMRILLQSLDSVPGYILKISYAPSTINGEWGIPFWVIEFTDTLKSITQRVSSTTQIQAAYEMVIWGLRTGYIKKKEAV